MKARITTASVRAKFKNDAEIARFFDIEQQAVCQWKKYIPRQRALELMIRLPEKFPPESNGNA